MRINRLFAPLLIPAAILISAAAWQPFWASALSGVSSQPLALPHSITALAAIHRARIAIAHARQVCRQAIAAARRQEAASLKLAERSAMRRNDLKEAVLISRWATALPAGADVGDAPSFRAYWRVGNRRGPLPAIQSMGSASGIHFPAHYHVFFASDDPAPGVSKIVVLRWPSLTICVPDPEVSRLTVRLRAR